MRRVRIVYPEGVGSMIDGDFIDEAEAMRAYGFEIATRYDDAADVNIYRGPCVRNGHKYPCGDKWLNNWDNNRKTLFISEFLPLIDEISIPTFMVDDLENEEIESQLVNCCWQKAFVRSDTKSLYFHDLEACIWPNTTFREMARLYERFGLSGPFAIREFIDNEDIFYEEQRYWVLNGQPYHPSGFIPDVARTCAERIFKFSGSHYFTVDVAGDFIVEVNPGESSDRGCDNPLDFFCKIFQIEFLKINH